MNTYHLVIGKDGIVYEAKPVGFAECAEDIRNEQYGDVAQIIAMNAAEGWAIDVTAQVAQAILDDSPEHPVMFGESAYRLIEEHLGIKQARLAAWEWFAERDLNNSIRAEYRRGQ